MLGYTVTMLLNDRLNLALDFHLENVVPLDSIAEALAEWVLYEFALKP
jgi:hypothetical protein